MVLVADVSGYTKLTARLAEASGARRGAEAIARHLESTYELLIDVVHRAGGSVVGFAGDAMHCWFEREHTQRALGAALTLVRARLPSPELAVKVGLGAGSALRLALLESYHIELLAGEPMEQAGHAEKLARAGEVIAPTSLLAEYLEPSGYRTLEDATEWSRLLGAPHVPSATDQLAEPKALPDDVVQRWVLPPVWETARERTERPFSELRLGVPLFVEFVGLTCEGDPVARLHALAAQVESVVLGEGGYVIDAQGGTDRFTLYASFGAPVSHEDNPERALRAALALTRKTYPEGIRARAALALGRVRSGRLGARGRRVDAVVGRDVNLAARLLGHTEAGTVTASPALARAVEGRFSFASRGTRDLKGIDAPVEILEVVDALESGARLRACTPNVGLIGRELELGQLRGEARDHLLGGSGGLVWVSGAPGIGKTRLLDELTTNLGHPRVVRLQLQASSEHTPYGAVKALLAGLVSSDVERAELALDLGDLAPMAPLLESFFPPGTLPPGGGERLTDLSDEVRADNIKRALRRLIGRRVRALRTALLVEDLHWLDTSTATLLQDALRFEADLFVIGTSRELPTDAWAGLVKREVELRELPREATEALLSGLFGGRRVDSSLVHFVAERSQGHPLYAEELVRFLRDGGYLDEEIEFVRAKGGIDALEKLEIPTTLEGVLVGRIDRLGPEQAFGLQVLAVLGQRFPERALGELSRHLAWLARRSEELIALGLLLRHGDDLAFRHALLRDVAYGALDSRTRAKFHELVARYEEALHRTEAKTEHLIAAAHHFTCAYRDGRTNQDVQSRAARLSAAAAAEAHRVGAWREAVRGYRDALDIGGSGLAECQLREWRLELAESFRLWGKFAEARQELDLLLGSIEDTDAHRPVFGMLREVGRQVLHRLSPDDVEIQGSVDDRRRLVVAGRAHNMLSELAYFSDEKTLSLYAAVRTLNVLEQAGPTQHLALAYSAMGLLSGLFGLAGPSEFYWQKAEHLTATTALPHEVADVLRMRALGRLGTGRFREAEIDLAGAEQNHLITRDLRHLGDVITMRAMIAVFEERYEEALGHLAELDRCIDESDSALHRTWSAVWTGSALAALGRTNEAEPLLRSGVPLAEAAGDRQALLGARGQLGWLLVRTGRADEAEPLLDEVDSALQRAKGMPNGTAEYLGYAGLFEARLALVSEPSNSAPPSAEQLERFTRAAGYWDGFVRLFPFGEPYRRLARALVHRHSGTSAHSRVKKEIARGLVSTERFSVPSLRARLEEARST